MSSLVHSFDEFRVRLAERELWQGGVLRPVNRYIFDAIAYLIEHRDRAVGRDELVAAVWGRVEVSEGHLNQVIARARRVLGDDAQTQRLIRTVPAFGYRWVGPVDTSEAPAESRDMDRPEPAAYASDPADATAAARAEARPGARSRRRRHLLAALACLLAGGVVWAAVVHLVPGAGPPTAADVRDAQALVVLPIAVTGAPESGWLELGAMDLVADRLRRAGLRVSPSKTVVTALYGAASPVTASDHARVREVLGAGRIVQGEAVHGNAGWRLRLTMTAPSGENRRVEATREDAIEAARVASDLLLAALGLSPPGEEAGTRSVRERLQQAQAASLTNQLDLARTILQNIPREAATAREVLLRLAELDFRSGRLDETATALQTLLASPELATDPLTRGRALVLRGNLQFRRSDFASAVHDLDDAVGLLDGLDSPLDLCDALTRRGVARVALRDLDGGSSDYSRARLLAEQAGDRLRVAHVEAGVGLLEIDRKRLDVALPYLDAAMRQYEAFGVIERVVTLRQMLIDTYSSLLRWPEVAGLNERQWAVRDRIGDPGLALTIANRRARLLLALGRLAEDEQLVAASLERHADLRPESLRYLYDMEADLAWHRGQPREALQAAEAALANWPRDPSYDRYAYLVLLRQRALIASGRADAASIERWLPTEQEGVSPVFRVAQAEWAVQRGDRDAADAYFDQALAAAETAGTPALIAFVAQASVDWHLARGRTDLAAELAGRVAVWAQDDFDCALLRVKVFHALGNVDVWRLALEAADALAGERSIPAPLRSPPGSAPGAVASNTQGLVR